MIQSDPLRAPVPPYARNERLIEFITRLGIDSGRFEPRRLTRRDFLPRSEKGQLTRYFIDVRIETNNRRQILSRNNERFVFICALNTLHFTFITESWKNVLLKGLQNL